MVISPANDVIVVPLLKTYTPTLSPSPVPPTPSIFTLPAPVEETNEPTRSCTPIWPNPVAAIPPLPVMLISPLPVEARVAPLRVIPLKNPAVVPLPFAIMLMPPSTVPMLAPAWKLMLWAVVIFTTPVPLVEMSLVLFGKLTAPAALATRFMLEARVTAPTNESRSKGLPVEPIVRLAVKSGRAETVRSSVALPRLTVSEPVGLAKLVSPNVFGELDNRDSVLPVVPSSSSVTTFGPAGKLKITSDAAPRLEIGSRPV